MNAYDKGRNPIFKEFLHWNHCDWICGIKRMKRAEEIKHKGIGLSSTYKFELIEMLTLLVNITVWSNHLKENTYHELIHQRGVI